MFERLRRKDPGRPLGALLFYELCWHAALGVATLLYGVRRFGLERVPPTGPLLVVANHQSHLDPPLVGFCLRDRHLVFIARQGLFKNRFFAWLIRNLNAIPIREEEGDMGAIRAVLEQLKNGRAVLIFPEGSRSPDGAVREFKRGAWLLLSRAKCPVLPVAVEGCFEAWPRRRALPYFFGRRIAAAVGAPIAYERLKEMGAEAGLRHLAQTVDALRRTLPPAPDGPRPAGRAGPSGRRGPPSQHPPKNASRKAK